MKDCAFLKGGHELFTTIGIPYGILMIEDFLPFTTYCLDDGSRALREAVERGFITTVQEDDVKTAMIQAGLVADMAALYQKVRQFEAPPDHRPVHKFRLCVDCKKNPLPHGYIIAADSFDPPILSLSTLFGGLTTCDKMVQAQKWHVLDCAIILKVMVESDLPTNSDDANRRYCALPEDVRRKYGSEQAPVGHTKINGGGRIFTMDFPADPSIVEAILGKTK